MDTYFEISESDNFVRIEPIEYSSNNSNMDWDKNWIQTKITITAGSFSGSYAAEFMTVYFKKLKEGFETLYNNLDEKIIFKDLESYLKLEITGDGIGHFEMDVEACDDPGIYGHHLNFTMNFDQTYLPGFVSQLDEIINKFPVIGNI